MFNAPRAAQRYGSTPGNGFGTGSFVDDNPLGGSVYDDGGLDPWSAGPSPSATPAPQATATLFNSVIGALLCPSGSIFYLLKELQPMQLFPLSIPKRTMSSTLPAQAKSLLALSLVS